MNVVGSDRLNAVLADALVRATEASGLPLVPDDLRWYTFPQVWGTTALGFPNIGLCAITTAQTYVVDANIAGAGWFVYFGGRFAYRVRGTTDTFLEALGRHTMPSVANARSLEGARCS